MPEPHRFTLRVYYEDTDFSGVVYHANYLRFLERGRTELLRACGIAQRELRDEALALPLAFAVRRMTLEFLRPALMDDLLVIETAVTAIGGASVDMTQQVLRNAEPLLEAQVRIGLVGGGRPRRLPAGLSARLAGGGFSPEKPPDRHQGAGSNA